MVPFSFPRLEAKGDFSPIFTMKTWSSFWTSYNLVLLEILILRFVHTEPLAICQIQSGFPTQALISSLVPLRVSAPLSLNPLYPPVSPILGAVVCPVSSLLSSMDPIKVVDFSVFSAFYLLQCSGSFQAPYMLNWKPEVLPIPFKFWFLISK